MFNTRNPSDTDRASARKRERKSGPADDRHQGRLPPPRTQQLRETNLGDGVEVRFRCVRPIEDSKCNTGSEHVERCTFESFEFQSLGVTYILRAHGNQPLADAQTRCMRANRSRHSSVTHNASLVRLKRCLACSHSRSYRWHSSRIGVTAPDEWLDVSRAPGDGADEPAVRDRRVYSPSSRTVFFRRGGEVVDALRALPSTVVHRFLLAARSDP